MTTRFQLEGNLECTQEKHPFFVFTVSEPASWCLSFMFYDLPHPQSLPPPSLVPFLSFSALVSFHLSCSSFLSILRRSLARPFVLFQKQADFKVGEIYEEKGGERASGERQGGKERERVGGRQREAEWTERVNWTMKERKKERRMLQLKVINSCISLSCMKYFFTFQVCLLGCVYIKTSPERIRSRRSYRKQYSQINQTLPVILLHLE